MASGSKALGAIVRGIAWLLVVAMVALLVAVPPSPDGGARWVLAVLIVLFLAAALTRSTGQLGALSRHLGAGARSAA